MVAWCLPKALSSKFLNALRDGSLAPEKLLGMTSEERRAAFAEHVGPENAREINAQFESKMLLKDQQRGLVSWARKIGGLTEPARRDILTSIGKLDRILNPEEENAFLADLAAKKLGVTVTADEAKTIFQLSQTAEQLRAKIAAQGAGDYRAGWTAENGTAYGRARLALLDQIESLKPQGGTIANKLLNVLSLPKSALTSILHWSAPFVQGWGMISTKQWWSGLGQMFQYFASEDHYQGLNAYIIAHPDYELARDGKLGLTALGDKLSTREESIQSSLLEGANEWLSAKTGVPNLISAWSRSFTGFLNYVRFNRFTQLLDAARLSGEDVRPGSQVVKDLANVVNNFTGRGELGEGDKYASAGPLLNAAFFSPRKMVATMEMFNPVKYVRLTPIARNAALRQLAGSLIATGAVLTLAKVMGAQVSFDPRSSDFAKINIGGEKLDMTGGNASYLRFLTRIASGQELSAAGKLTELGATPHGTTRADVATNFIRGKLAPIPGLIADALYGHNPAGQAFSVTDEIRNKMFPIVINSWLDFALNNPNDTAAIVPALSALLGVGLESPLPPMSESGRDVWGEAIPPFGTPKNWTDDPVTKAAQSAGLYLNFPANTIRGVKLNDAQYQQYVQNAGKLAHLRLEQLVADPRWSAIPQAGQKAAMQDVIRSAREAAASAVMLQSQGSRNDIVQQADSAKRAKLMAMSAAEGVAAQ